MVNLFMDSNIWLSVYDFSKDDLDQFAKLKGIIDDKVRVFIPEQVWDEVLRNRDSKLKEVLKDFNGPKQGFPVFARGYDEFNEIKNDYVTINIKMEKWKKTIEEDIKNMNLPADRVLLDFFKPHKLINCEKYIEKAIIRSRIGNPPGKPGSIGDAINWLCLLDSVPQNENICIISADGDYSSEYNKDDFNVFLKREWKERKGAEVLYYRSLVSFLNKHIKDINIQAEKDKLNKIEELKNSRSFESTHRIISTLNNFDNWTLSQVEDLCYCLIYNTQVEWIAGDYDVQSFYRKTISSVDSGNLPEDSIVFRAVQLLDEQKYDDEDKEDFYIDMIDEL